MAQTYVDVSNKFIIPGVNKIDRLSITLDHEPGESEINMKIKAVEDFSRQAQKEISTMASAVSRVNVS